MEHETKENQMKASDIKSNEVNPVKPRSVGLQKGVEGPALIKPSSATTKYWFIDDGFQRIKASGWWASQRDEDYDH